MKRFSIIVTPQNANELSSFIPTMVKLIPGILLFSILRFLPPFRVGKILLKGKEEMKEDIMGDIILCPLKEERKMPSPGNFKRIIKSMQLAQKNSPNVIGLGNSNSYNNANYGKLNRMLNMQLVTGEYLNAVNNINHIKDLLRNHQVDEETCKILMIGNLNDDFSVFYLELLSSYYKKIMLLDIDHVKLSKVLDRIIYETGTVITPIKDEKKALKKALEEADLIIFSANILFEINLSWLKSNAIVNLLVENKELKQQLAARKDIKLIDGGGLVEIQDAEINGIGLNNKKVYPWVAETILNLIDIKLKTNLSADRLSVRIAHKTCRSAIRNKFINLG